MGGAIATSAQPADIPPAGTGQDMARGENGSTVFLSVTLNGSAGHDLVPFVERGQALYLPRESALQLKFSTAFLDTVSEDTPLADYPGVSYDYHRDLQSIDITAPLSNLTLDTTVLGTPSNPITHAAASPGMLLNYDLYSSYTNRDDLSLSGFTEWRGFGDLGLVSSSHLFQGLRTGGQPQWEYTAVRMDTVLEHSLQDEQITFRLGDTLTNGTAWSRRTRIGGFQVSRNFSLQPYRTTAPLPAYFGSATLPTSVELYINGIQQYTGQVPAGPFELNALPTVSGAGNAQVVLTDALGRRTSVDFPFYNSSRLLREGLSDWSFETGYVRTDYGYRSFGYDSRPMASGTLRYGFTNVLTGESHLEGGQGIVSGGVGAVMNIGTMGTVSGSWAQSRNEGTRGGQYTIGYELQHGFVGLGANLQRADAGYRDVASALGGTPVLRSDSAYIGFNVGVLGSISMNYAYLQQAEQPRYRYGGLSWSRNFARGAALSLSANQNLDDRSDRSVYLTLTINLDGGLSTYGSAAQSKETRTYSAGARYTARADTDWSWNVQGQNSESRGMSASAQANRSFQVMDLNLGVNSAGNDQNAYAGASGSVVLMGGNLFASRRLSDGFALVSTSGVPGVPVKSENRPVGVTDGGGRLLVPRLRSYQHNKISIDPLGLPVDVRIDTISKDAVPRHGSGLNVEFRIERVQAATVILQNSAGQFIPMGAQATLNDAPQSTSWVGYDGRLYLEGLQAQNHLTIQDGDTQCALRFPYVYAPGTLPEIGPLVCTP